MDELLLIIPFTAFLFLVFYIVHISKEHKREKNEIENKWE